MNISQISTLDHHSFNMAPKRVQVIAFCLNILAFSLFKRLECTSPTLIEFYNLMYHRKFSWRNFQQNSSILQLVVKKKKTESAYEERMCLHKAMLLNHLT